MTAPAAAPSAAAKVAKYTIVVSIVEGRHFPRRTGASAYVQCKFNDEALLSDPAPLGPAGSPIWDTELAWDLDAKALHFLRVNRTPIKVTVFALSAQGGTRSVLGHLVLDLRQAQPFPAKEVWIPLLPPPPGASNVAAASWGAVNGPRPEIKLSFGSGPQGSDMPALLPAQSHFTPTKPTRTANTTIASAVSPRGGAKPRSPTRPSAASFYVPPAQRRLASTAERQKQLQESLSALNLTQQQDGSFKFGDNPDRLFRLAVTVVGIEGLHLLSVLPSVNGGDADTTAADLPAARLDLGPAKGYFVLMQILGNELRTQSFTDTKRPEFPEETLTIDLVACKADLATFLRSMDRLPVYLCYDEQILGSATIDLLSLLSTGSSLEQLESSHHEYLLDILEDSAIDLKLTEHPKVKLRVGLTELPAQTLRPAPALGAEQPASVPAPASAPASLPVLPAAAPPASLAQPVPPPAVVIASPAPAAAAPAPVASTVEPPSTTFPTLPNIPSTISAMREEYHQQQQQQQQQANGGAALAAAMFSPPTASPLSAQLYPPISASAPPAPGSHQLHQYRFSIDIKAVKDLQGTYKSANMYFKYAYPPFGTRAPFLSHPPVQVTRGGGEVVLNSAFCAYEFVMVPERLRVFFDAVPLEILAIHKDPFARDTTLGAALAHLSRTLDAPVQSTATATGQPLAVQVYDHWINVCASLPGPPGGIVKVAAIRVVLCLENFGPIEEQNGAVDAPDAFANTITIPPSVTVGALPPAPPAALDAAGAPRLEVMPATPMGSHLGLNTASAPAPLPIYGGVPQQPAPPVAPAVPDQVLWDRAHQQVEEWRQRQEQRLEQAIRDRDAAAMKELESRLRAREAEFERKAAEFATADQELHRILADMERREQALQREEQDLIQRRVDLERDFEARCARVEDAARSLEADAADRREHDRLRAAELERQRTTALAERDDWERKYRALDAAFFEFKSTAAEAAKGAPEARELAARLKETADALHAAEKRGAVYKKQRAHFKQQWLKTLADYAQFKKDADRRVDELEHEIKRRDLVAAAGASVVVAASPAVVPQPQLGVTAPTPAPAATTAAAATEMEIKQIRAELDELRSTHEHFKQSLGMAGGGIVGGSGDRGGAFGATSPHPLRMTHIAPPPPAQPAARMGPGPEQLAQLERLVQERDLLLKSGVYTPQDHLIREMTARIDQLSMR
ncbi:hypothetical protein H9P43_001499 [Blastocladiella emersonii ATCC 22665]|nr:hypothetical protein H9P43_001499 [Blastocladiella emersonii ATCC 22665]